ncbi:T9SS type A sorting domain-containing protein, partial [candidate division WOR-3 bacterium]|nr:T9SS type A sorting domain-containing protein [candidate division WOR-3 bacterium]
TPGAGVRTANVGPTIVRGTLMLSPLGTRSGLSDNPVMSRAALLDAAGRKLLDLKPGANDVSRLAPGVYYVVPGSDSVRSQKIIIAGKD